MTVDRGPLNYSPPEYNVRSVEILIFDKNENKNDLESFRKPL